MVEDWGEFLNFFCWSFFSKKSGREGKEEGECMYVCVFVGLVWFGGLVNEQASKQAINRCMYVYPKMNE